VLSSDKTEGFVRLNFKRFFMVNLQKRILEIARNVQLKALKALYDFMQKNKLEKLNLLCNFQLN
jgi:hypothetical protein